MTDDELRTLLARAHAADAPPRLGALLARAPRPRPRWPLAAAVLLAGAAAGLLLWARPRPAPRLDLAVAWSAPLDFLLDVPGTDLLRATPRFDLKGTLP
jgi:hypothetical protein